MSHLHIPDGVLPVWLWAGGFGVLALILILLLWRANRRELARKLPFLGTVTALMVLGMSFPVVPLMYHFNFTVLAGVILGPVSGALAAFLSSLILAFFGHGGITVIGLNSLILIFEVTAGWFFFRVVFRLSAKAVFWRGFLATFFTLIASTFLAIGVVTLGGAEFSRFAEVSIALGVIGWILESVIIGFIVSYLQKIKPGILPGKAGNGRSKPF